MSQSDYIKYKKVQNELQINNKSVVAKKNIPNRMNSVYFNQPSVFDSSDYDNYMEYTLENTIVNTKPVLNRLTPAGKQVVWNMDKTVPNNCATFLLCNNTNTRPNRKLNTIGYSPTSKCKIRVTPVPLNINSAQNNTNIKNSCICAENKSSSQNYMCKCKSANYYGGNNAKGGSHSTLATPIGIFRK
jgi:hypothetical protein